MISRESVSRSSVQATDPCSSVQWHYAKLDVESRWGGSKEALLAWNSTALKKTAELALCLQLPVKSDALPYLPRDSGRGQL